MRRVYNRARRARGRAAPGFPGAPVEPAKSGGSMAFASPMVGGVRGPKLESLSSETPPRVLAGGD
jgi:hypothetical protein